MHTWATTFFCRKSHNNSCVCVHWSHTITRPEAAFFSSAAAWRKRALFAPPFDTLSRIPRMHFPDRERFTCCFTSVSDYIMLRRRGGEPTSPASRESLSHSLNRAHREASSARRRGGGDTKSGSHLHCLR
jgi:hypothetical protein